MMALLDKPDTQLARLVDAYMKKLPNDGKPWKMSDTERRRQLGRSHEGVWETAVLISIMKHPQFNPRKFHYKKLGTKES